MYALILRKIDNLRAEFSCYLLQCLSLSLSQEFSELKIIRTKTVNVDSRCHVKRQKRQATRYLTVCLRFWNSSTATQKRNCSPKTLTTLFPSAKLQGKYTYTIYFMYTFYTQNDLKYDSESSRFKYRLLARWKEADFPLSPRYFSRN